MTVNGRARQGMAESRKTLADFIREDLELTGTHLGCEHGVCGACTVLVDGVAVRSCLMLAVQARDSTIMTIDISRLCRLVRGAPRMAKHNTVNAIG